MDAKTTTDKYSYLQEFPDDILECIFGYLRKPDVMSTALTCIKFSRIFARPKLIAAIHNNTAIDYRDMNNGELQSMLLQRPHHGEFILRIVQERFLGGTLEQPMLRSVIASCPLHTLFRFGLFFQLLEDSPIVQDKLITRLLEKIVCSADYYAGQPESHNSHFMSLVGYLGGFNIRNSERFPELKLKIILLFQYTYLSLPDDLNAKSSLAEIFDHYFAIPVISGYHKTI